MKQRWRILITSLLSLSQIACFVDENDTPPRQRTTDNLRVYQVGDRLEYDISGLHINSNTALTGSLTVAYGSHAPLPENPFNGSGSISVVKESAILTTNIGSAEYSEGTVRFISQDPTGNLSLHAYDSADPGQYYWVNAVGDPFAAIQPVVITASPYATGQSRVTSFYVLPGCDLASNCDVPFASLSEDQRVVGTEDVVTSVGKFDAFKVSINSANLLKSANYPNLLTSIDFRHFCNDIDSALPGTATVTGDMWVFPEVGVVKYSISCTNTSGGIIRMNALLSNTNISLPN